MGIARGELPGNAPALVVAFAFYRLDVATQSRLAFQAQGEGIALEDRDLDLGHIQPTAVLGV